MPLYEYECTACHRHTEKIQKFSDPEITTCPHCGGLLKRVITAPAISFKGGGWYADGYGNAKPASSGDSSAAPGDASSATSKPDPASSGSETKSSGGETKSSGSESTSAPTVAAPAPAAPASSPSGTK